MTLLDGWTVVVTRPAQQSAGLVAQLEAAGAHVLAWPTLTIEALAVDVAQREQWTPDRHDWLIYTSVNAVEHALRLWPGPQTARVAAIGRATARALRARGVDVDVTPPSGANSEALLATPTFIGVQGRRILILAGQGGRETLRRVLVSRGADVCVAELYVRRPITPTAARLAELERKLSAPQAMVMATSVDVLAALLRPLPSELQQRLMGKVLVVPGERVATAARAAGWHGPLVVADSAEDDLMIAAFVGWLAGGADERA